MVFPDPNTPIPTERNAEQLQAFAKLLVIMHDLNGGEWKPVEGESVSVLSWFRVDNSFCVEIYDYQIYTPIYFRTGELAHKALEANEQIFRDFYGV
jgi:hypothetical protein